MIYYILDLKVLKFKSQKRPIYFFLLIPHIITLFSRHLTLFTHEELTVWYAAPNMEIDFNKEQKPHIHVQWC